MPLPSSWEQDREQIERDLRESLASHTDLPEPLRAAVSHSLLAGGKRLRPVLCLMAARVCGVGDDRALPAASAVEMVHTYSLVHDDLPAMDDDDLRRGKPTCHVAFGEGLAILAGDALLTLAFETLAERIADPVIAAACCGDLARAAGWRGMVGGQVADLIAEGRIEGDPLPDNPRDRFEVLKDIHRRKTGRLICAALTLGGRMAGADAETLFALESYGSAVGLAFQIADDLLDLLGDEQTLGKGVRKDAALGKLTYPGLLGVEESRAMAAELITTAHHALDRFGDDADPLRDVAAFIIERDH